MLERLLHIDTEILLAINGWHAPWADTLMWIISAKTTWIPPLISSDSARKNKYFHPYTQPGEFHNRIASKADAGNFC